MTDKEDKLKAGLLKDILKQMKGANEQFEKIAQAEMEAAAEGKGFISGTFAKAKARERIAQEYMMATKGAINKRQAIFDTLGLEKVGKMAEAFFPGEKTEPPAELVKKFGLDKKSAKRGGVGNIAKPLSLILRNVISTNKIVKTIEKSLSKASAPRSSRYVFDPRMAGGGRYRDTVTNKLVSTKEVQSERTAALTAAIGADEQPLVQLKESLDSRFEELNDSIKNIKKLESTVSGIKFSIDGIIPRVTDLSVHSKLDLLLKQAAADILDDVDTPDRRKNKRTRPTRPTRPVRPGMGGLARLAIGGTAVAATALVVGGTAYMASGKAADVAKESMKELERKYGLKTLYDSKGNTVGYSVDDKKYDLDNLPQEYKDLILAYGPGDKRNASARDAIARIKKFSERYKALELVNKPKQMASVQTPPPPAPIQIKPPASTAAPTTPVQSAITTVKETVTKAITAGGTATMATGAAVSAAAKTGVDKVKDIIVSAANRVGVNPGIMLAMGQQESSFNPSAQPYITDKKTGQRRLLSSAKGIFQFINSTWDSMVKKYSAAYPELLKGAFDPEANALAGALYVKENSEFLKKRSIPVTGTSIYATHFLGPGGAAKLFSAPKEALASEIMPGPAASNPHIFFDKGKPKTIQQVIDTLYKKVGSKAEMFQAQVDGGKIGGLDAGAPTQPMLASAPTQNMTPTARTTGAEATQQSKQYDTSKMVASASPPAAPVVINNNAGGNKMPPQPPKQPMPMASTRPSENSYNRAISNDFAHPTAFTSVGMV